jgi:hypothetical protein
LPKIYIKKKFFFVLKIILMTVHWLVCAEVECDGEAERTPWGADPEEGVVGVQVEGGCHPRRHKEEDEECGNKAWWSLLEWHLLLNGAF